MGKTIRGFNGQPSEPDYPLPADLPFSVAPTTDNGARALAERLRGTGVGLGAPELAAAILANGAAFIEDAADLVMLPDADPTWAHTPQNDPAGLYDDSWEYVPVPSPEPLPQEALDVERLARALQAWMGRGPAIQLPLAQAQELADLYAAALSPDRPTLP